MQPDHLQGRYDVIILGGGMVGMSLAIALAHAGIRIALVEKLLAHQQVEAGFDGRVSAIALGSKRLLEGIGAWAGMLPHAEPIRDIRVSDGDSPFFVHYDHEAIGEEPFGWIVENRYIRQALQEAAAGLPSLTVMDGVSVASMAADDQGAELQLDNGQALRCRLTVGADGKKSSLRTMNGIGVTEWGYEQTAIVCTIAHTHPHDGLAQERFLPAGPFAVLPMTDNRSSLVWAEPAGRASLYLELPEDEFVQEIRERVGDYLGELTLTGPRFAYPLSLTHAKRYVGKRLALIGDAAHSIHPIAGQGVNLGFRDVGVLSQLVIERFRLGLDIGTDETLRHYQRWRRFDNVAMLSVTDGLNRLFSNNILPVKLARGLGLWGVQHLPSVKRFFMRDAMGLAGDLPWSLQAEDATIQPFRMFKMGG